MTAILGISAFYHDAAAALLVDGSVVAAAQEERFTRKKHDAAFPGAAIDYCLREGKLQAADLDFVGFYEKPLLKFDRLLETYLSFAPVGFRSFLKAMPPWLGQKLHLRREIRDGLGGEYQKRIVFCQHHESHAASAFYPSPFDEAAILTLDGVGEWTTTSFGVGSGNRVKLLGELRFPHSLGLLYSAFTYFTGFRVNSGEYKLMGLAPFGEPRFTQLILDKLVDLKADGSFRLDMRYFNYCQGLTMTSRRFEQLFAAPPRKPDAPIRSLDMDLAASIQKVAEEIILRIAAHVQRQTGLKKLCLAGGVALNCVANGRVLRESSFEEIWIQPAAGDAGGSLGVAQLIWHQLLGNDRCSSGVDAQAGSLLGPRSTPDDVLATLRAAGARFTKFESEEELCDRVAALLAEGNVVGWSQGRMEFGPRALGSRSILGDPRSAEMQSVMNRKIKFRESFRPFAPSVLRERAADYFAMSDATESPYMLLVFDVDSDRCQPECSRQSRPTDQGAQRVALEGAVAGLQRVQEKRGSLPAITHVDYTARVQTVDAQRFPRFHKLLTAFEAQTGCPALINTSFNVRGEPVVCTPEDAYRCFMATNMDALVLEDFLLLKGDQPESVQIEIDEHLARFMPD